MSRTIALAGKGGTGKTTLAFGLALAFTQSGVSTTLIEANTASPTLCWLAGASGVKRAVQHAFRGDCTPMQALYRHPSGLRVMPASPSLVHGDLFLSGLKNVLLQCADPFGITILDLPAGSTATSRALSAASSQTIVVTTPDLHAVLDTIRIVRSHKSVKHIVLNKCGAHAHELPVKNIEAMTKTPVLGAVPADDSVLKAGRSSHPFVFSYPDATASKSIYAIAQKLLQLP